MNSSGKSHDRVAFHLPDIPSINLVVRHATYVMKSTVKFYASVTFPFQIFHLRLVVRHATV